MTKGSNSKTSSSTGGAKDSILFPRFWHGMGMGAYARLLRQNGWAVAPQRWPTAASIGIVSAINSKYWLLQELLLGRKIRRTEIEHHPVFILGHWRSGTTLLHEMLVLDKRHVCPDNYSCFAPNHFVLTGGLFPRMLWFLMPSHRPMDNMKLGWGTPQEDEFALCNMGLPSPYLTIAFPNRPPQNENYFDLERVSTADLAQWKERFTWFLKCLTARNPGRIVLKSPPHTFRVKHLLDMFPDARFVHIVRDPFAIFPSTVHLWRRLYKVHGFQIPQCEGLDEYVFNTFNRMYEVFESQRGLIPQGRFSEVRYEDLVASPVEQMRRIYEELDLGGFEEAHPALEEHAAGMANYKKNRFELPAETREEIGRRWGWFMEKYGYK